MILATVAILVLIAAILEINLIFSGRSFRREMARSRRPLYVNGKLVTNSVGGPVYV